MMTRLLVAALICGVALPAAAEPRKILVMQSEGRADAKLRARIDATLLRLARATGVDVTAGDITFADAAAAVGCKADDAPCKDEVLGMLAVDEIVIATATPKPGGVEVAVRRIGKGGASRDTTSLVAPDKLDTLDAIAPLFAPASAKAAPPAPAPAPPATPPIGPTRPPAPATTTAPAPPPTTGTPAGPQLPPAVSTAPSTSPEPPGELFPPPDPEPAPSLVTTSPPPLRDAPPPSRRLQKIGMVGGATLLVAGLVFWGAALGIQGDIDDAPTATEQQLRDLQDLEAKGDRYAMAGNVLVLAGAAIGAISTYSFIQRGRAQTTARLQPAAFDGGVGIALSFGGTP